jgi:ankyrin repeat protein
LLEAAMNGHESTVRVAIEAGANVDFVTARHGNTAAHLAASNGHIGVLNLLRAAGARLDVERGGDGKTALQLHKELVQKQLATVLRK